VLALLQESACDGPRQPSLYPHEKVGRRKPPSRKKACFFAATALYSNFFTPQDSA
jgi:hypothetical protein